MSTAAAKKKKSNPTANMVASSALAPPTAVQSTGTILEVDVQESPLRLRETPRIDAAQPTSNVIARLPDGHRVRLLVGKTGAQFYEVETSLYGAYLRGFAAAKFLRPAEDGAEVPVAQPASAPPAVGIIAIYAPNRFGSLVKRTTNAGAQSLNEPNQPTRSAESQETLATTLHTIIRYLDVEKPSHLRYQPREGLTFCNIYAHDYCYLAGAFLPRVWWTADAIEQLAKGITVIPRVGSTIDEQRANDLFRWLRAFGERFGWRQTGTLTKLQAAANAGGIGLIVALRKDNGRPGHIAVVVPERDGFSAKRDASGEVVSPLQSQAGATNFRYGTGALNWWTRPQFADNGFWVHA